MHNALVVVGQVKDVTIVVNFKVALLSPEQRVKMRGKCDRVNYGDPYLSQVSLLTALSMNEKVSPYFHPLQFYVFSYYPDIAVPV